MAPLTGYRRWLDAVSQLRANSWMLMTGSMGMVASTLPVQWLLPAIGWRPLFWGLAGLLLLSMVVIVWQVPRWEHRQAAGTRPKFRQLRRRSGVTAYFRRMTPLGFFNYGGMVAIQTLWAVPWMIRVAGYTPVQAATSLFWINVAMLTAFWSWGLLIPRSDPTRGAHQPAHRLGYAAEPDAAGGHRDRRRRRSCSTSGLLWALFCVSSTFLSLAQPAVGMAFPAELAGRALSAYNLVIFAGVFAVQWGLGLLIDGFAAAGWTTGRRPSRARWPCSCC